MCEHCEKYIPLEKEMTAHFNNEMNKYALEHELDLVGVRNVLFVLLDSVEKQLVYLAVKDKMDNIRHNNSAPVKEAKEVIPDFSDADFNKLISEI